jgi:hypothetical protein
MIAAMTANNSADIGMTRSWAGSAPPIMAATVIVPAERGLAVLLGHFTCR